MFQYQKFGQLCSKIGKVRKKGREGERERYRDRDTERDRQRQRQRDRDRGDRESTQL